MSDSNPFTIHAVLVEEEVQFTLDDLCRLCSTDTEQLLALVDEGALVASGDDPRTWRFGGASLQRARAAMRLTRDLQLNAAGAALVLDLLDRIEALEARLRRLGHA